MNSPDNLQQPVFRYVAYNKRYLEAKQAQILDRFTYLYKTFTVLRCTNQQEKEEESPLLPPPARRTTNHQH